MATRAAPRRPSRPRKPRPERRGRLWRWRRWLFAIGLLGFAVVAGGLYYLSRIPLPSPAPLKQTTFVYDSSGQARAGVVFGAEPGRASHSRRSPRW